jgi:hypothetical protein
MQHIQFHDIDENQDAFKKELLKHYSDSEPKEFIQPDAYDVGPNYNDGIGLVVSGPEGIALTGGGTVELMKSDVAVRALIDPNASQKTVLKSLDELRDWVKRDWEALSGLRHSFICKQLVTKIPSNDNGVTNESQDQSEDDDYQTKFFITASEECIECEGTGTSIEFGITCQRCDGHGHRNEYEIPFSDVLTQDDVFNRLWNIVETMQEKINELEGRIKRLGG